MVDQELIVARVREMLPAESIVVEKSMFGGRAFMLDGALLLSVLRSGDLLVRVDPASHDDFLTRPGAVQGEMGGRTMGLGWLRIDGAEMDRVGLLRSWVDEAIEYNHRAARPRGSDGSGDPTD